MNWSLLTMGRLVVCRLFCTGSWIEKLRLGRTCLAVLQVTAIVRIMVEKQGHLNDNRWDTIIRNILLGLVCPTEVLSPVSLHLKNQSRKNMNSPGYLEEGLHVGTLILREFGCLILSFPSTTHHECNIVSTSKNMPLSLLSFSNCSFALPWSSLFSVLYPDLSRGTSRWFQLFGLTISRVSLLEDAKTK